MQISSIAKRYAQSLYDYAAEEKSGDAVRSDCRAIRELLDQPGEFPDVIANPTLSSAIADQVIMALFADSAHSVTLRFMRFLASKGRLSLLGEICDAYEQFACDSLGIISVHVTAAHAFTDAQLTALKGKLHDQYNKTIQLDVELDPSLMGGFKIQVGDSIRDYSLRSKLDQFEQRVIKARHRHTLKKEFIVKREGI